MKTRLTNRNKTNQKSHKICTYLSSVTDWSNPSWYQKQLQGEKFYHRINGKVPACQLNHCVEKIRTKGIQNILFKMFAAEITRILWTLWLLTKRVYYQISPKALKEVSAQIRQKFQNYLGFYQWFCWLGPNMLPWQSVSSVVINFLNSWSVPVPNIESIYFCPPVLSILHLDQSRWHFGLSVPWGPSLSSFLLWVNAIRFNMDWLMLISFTVHFVMTFSPLTTLL